MFTLMFVSLFLFTANVFSVSLSTPAAISDPAVQSSQARVVSNASGQAIAVWTTTNEEGNPSIAGAAYSEGGTWTTPKTISTGSFASVAINSNGHAIAAWIDPQDNYQGVTQQIWASFYNRNSDTWSAPVQISNSTTTVYDPQVVLDDGGNAFTVWEQTCACSSMCIRGLIVSSVYASSSSTWSTPTFFTDCESSTKHSQEPTLSMNDLGQVMTFWTERFTTSTNINLVGKAYENGSWNVANVIASNLSTTPEYGGGLDDSGNAMAVWLAKTENGNAIQSSIYSQDQWSTPSTVLEDSIDPKFGYSSEGTGLLVWGVRDGGGFIVKGMIYNNSTWSSPFIICSQENINGYPISSAADGNSGAVAWGKGEPGGDTFVQLVTLVNGTWGSIVSEPTNTGRCPRVYNITVNSSGQIVAVWDDFVDGVSVIMCTAGTI